VERHRLASPARLVFLGGAGLIAVKVQVSHSHGAVGRGREARVERRTLSALTGGTCVALAARPSSLALPMTVDPMCWWWWDVSRSRFEKGESGAPSSVL
jgi:hypothetical protein